MVKSAAATIKHQRSLNWDISIPANTTALVYVPASKRDEVVEKLVGQKELKFIKLENNRVIYELGSGNYSFEVNSKH